LTLQQRVERNSMSQEHKNATLILAAGTGTRLAPITNSVPKALVNVAGKPLLGYALEALGAAASSGKSNVTIVVGYMGEKIASYVAGAYPFARVIWNHDYARTNNMYSLTLAMSNVEPGVDLIYMNGDCIYDPRIISSALSAQGSAIFCDEAADYNSESMKVTTVNDVVTNISKEIPEEQMHAVSCDLYKLGVADVFPMRRILFDFVSKGDLNRWSEMAIDKAATDQLIRFRPADVSGRFWCEIDNHDDLRMARDNVRRIVL
jgi:choline kinase